MKLSYKNLLMICLGILLCSHGNAQDIKLNETTFTFGGYAKLDVLFSRFHNGEVVDENPMRDFYFPALIPVGPSTNYDYLDFHVKESRFNLDVTTRLNNHKIRAFMEMDFMLSGVGNEKVSNSFNPRMRHFFFEYDNFLVGQTWSTFMNVILPDDLDFIGVPEGLVFIRQPQIRFTKGGWQFALENPTTTVTSYQSTSTRLTSSGGTPDIVVRRNQSGNWGMVSLAAIFRNLSMLDTAGIHKHEKGYGVSLAGKFIVGSKDDIRFMTTAGTGLGRYVGLNFVTSSVLCEMAQLHSIPSYNGYIAIQHQWSDKFKSSFNVAGFYADHDKNKTRLDPSINKSVWSGSANLLFNPVPNVLFGIEYMHAERELQSGVSGSFDRIQFSGKYNFKVTK